MSIIASVPEPVHYLPIATTVIAAVFFAVLLRRYLAKPGRLHLLWWAGGVFAYGLGTLLEGTITLFGNTIFLNKSWYIAGALLGGYPLAQGTVFLLCARRTAWILTAITVPVICITAVCVALSPVQLEQMQPHKPGGAILGWQWVRMLTPLINGYAAVFLIGGAIYSALRYARQAKSEDHTDREIWQRRALGNWLIAIGAILPGIGGGMAKAGTVEALYLGEFFGIILIWLGYYYCVNATAGATRPAVAYVRA